jgi:hypothetical protein
MIECYHVFKDGKLASHWCSCRAKTKEATTNCSRTVHYDIKLKEQFIDPAMF